jgi:phasin family protein
MLSEDETKTKPVKKAAQRKRKAEQDGKKVAPRKRKSTAVQEAPAEPLREAVETTIDTPVTLTETVPADAVADVAGDAPAVALADAPADPWLGEQTPLVPAAPTDAEAVSYQMLLEAYRDYTQQSLDQTQSYFARLASVRSFDKAIELQTEFARQAYEGFVAESRKLHELHSQLARQRLQHWESVVARMIGPR